MGNADSKSEDTVAVSPPPKESSSNGYASSPPPQLDHHEKREADALRSAPRDVRQRDDQIHVQMAMADLMAYLQVVANNSNHLPLTRRDDPELDRTVSTLSAEDFGRKSAAFVPADVRVLGGTFTRYGRVWDLPTSEVGAVIIIIAIIIGVIELKVSVEIERLFSNCICSLSYLGIQCLRRSPRTGTILRRRLLQYHAQSGVRCRQ